MTARVYADFVYIPFRQAHDCQAVPALPTAYREDCMYIVLLVMGVCTEHVEYSGE